MRSVVKKLIFSNEIFILILSLFYPKHTKLDLNLEINEYINAVLDELESIISPNIFCVLEKNCNFKIFNQKLGDLDFGIFKLNRKKSLEIDGEMTLKYIRGESLPGKNTFVLFSHFLDPQRFPNHFYYTFNIEGKIKKSVEQTFFKILNKLNSSANAKYSDEMIKYEKIEESKYILTRFELEGAGIYLETKYYNEQDSMMEELKKLKNKIKSLKFNFSKLIDTITNELILILKRSNVFNENFDVEEYPDIIPLIFPFKIAVDSRDRGQISQFLTIGFDLRDCLKSELRFAFNEKSVKKLIVTGGVWYMTTIWAHNQ
jgi:hypothetical protein